MAFNKNCLAKISKCYICNKPSQVKFKENWICYSCVPKKIKKILKNDTKEE